MNSPENLKDSIKHTGLETSDGYATIGFTDFAKSKLNEIVNVELPRVSEQFKNNEVFGSTTFFSLSRWKKSRKILFAEFS